MDIGGLGSSWRRSAIAGTGSQELKAGLDMRVTGVKLRGTLVRVQCIGDLVIAGFILRVG